MCFWIYGLSNTWLHKRQKCPISEDPSTSNMVNEGKHWSKLNDTTFTIFIGLCEGNSGWKSLKSRVSEDSSTSNMVNGPKDCSNLNDSTLPYLLILVKAIQTEKVCMIDMKLGIFVNLWTAHKKYYFLNRGNLFQLLQMKLSEKRKIFSQFSFAFPKFRFNFEHFQKLDDPHSWCIFDLTDSERRD